MGLINKNDHNDQPGFGFAKNANEMDINLVNLVHCIGLLFEMFLP